MMNFVVVRIPYIETLFIISHCLFLLKTNTVIFITKVVFGLNSFSLTEVGGRAIGCYIRIQQYQDDKNHPEF
jgi:hypothetical protein